MTQQVLSEKEIEALQKALAEKQVSLDDGNKEAPKVRKYDFVVQKRLTPKLFAILNVIFNRFLVNFRASLSLRLRRVLRMQLLTFDSQKFADLIDGLPSLCWLEILQLEPTHGQFIFIINPDLASVLIDLLCGGSGKISHKDNVTTFAPLEQSIMKKIIALALGDLERAWGTIVEGVKISSLASEFNPQLVTGFSPEDAFTIIPVKITLGDFSSTMAFAIPHYTLEPFKEQFLEKKEEVEVVDKNIVQRIINNLLDAEIEVTVELSQEEMTLRKIMELEEGQIIPLNKRISEEVIIKIEGVPRFKGYPVQFKGNKAVKISEVFRPFLLREVEKNEAVNTQGQSEGDS
ncbi:MAG: flagellar motor switch protein FliM [Candidatus Desulfofervidaceae bacterium]|nr:flagellar motor switch protein FliM [Candidatus Desulfofervidaceae bacterium]MDL1969685.1 FliM/FliN family flagellar motor switch protein [Candidatus Desulfofervidaceae bacterium]